MKTKALGDIKMKNLVAVVKRKAESVISGGTKPSVIIYKNYFSRYRAATSLGYCLAPGVRLHADSQRFWFYEERAYQRLQCNYFPSRHAEDSWTWEKLEGTQDFAFPFYFCCTTF